MTTGEDFKFSDKGVSASYDGVLVPILFEPWAEALVHRVEPIEGAHVIDVATGTGIVAQRLKECVGATGRVTAIDISAEMLSAAALRCKKHGSVVTLVESPAAPLAMESNSADGVYCQQGYQFFPDKPAAASEMLRVLKPGGKVAVSTWYPVDRCTWFGAIYDSLNRCDEREIANLIAVPFNHMPSDELVKHFTTAGFDSIELETPEADLVFPGGVEQAYETVLATPIGPKLRALPEEKQTEFREAFVSAVEPMTVNGVTTGRMVTNLLIAEKTF